MITSNAQAEYVKTFIRLNVKDNEQYNRTNNKSCYKIVFYLWLFMEAKRYNNNKK